VIGTRSVQRIVLLLLVQLTSAAFAQAPVANAIAGVEVSGRVINKKGRPIQLSLFLVPFDPRDATQPVAVLPAFDGRFTLSRVPPKKYKFSAGAGIFRVVPAMLEVDGRGRIKAGDIMVYPDVSVSLKLAQIIVDPVVIKKGLSSGGGTWSLSASDNDCNTSRPFGLGAADSDRYRTVEAFLGGKAKAIRVVRFLGTRPPETAEIQSRIMEVWAGVFRSASCGINWAEGADWNLEASVEFEDGTHGSLLMDGGRHVRLRDRYGRLWFLRLWPSMS
jgi:hypothetical protein